MILVHRLILQIKEEFCWDLNNLNVGQTVGVLLDGDSALHLYINGVDAGIAARDLPNICYAVIDLYGQTEQVTIVSNVTNSTGAGVDARPEVVEVLTVQPQAEYREKADKEDGEDCYSSYNFTIFCSHITHLIELLTTLFLQTLSAWIFSGVLYLTIHR